MHINNNTVVYYVYVAIISAIKYNKLKEAGKRILRYEVHGHSQRRYGIINIPRDFCAYQCTSWWVCPHAVAVLKLRSLQGISSSNVIIIVSISDHSHIYLSCLIWGSWGITLKNRHQSLLCKVYGNKSDDTAILSEHVIISYLLWDTAINAILAGTWWVADYSYIIITHNGMPSIDKRWWQTLIKICYLKVTIACKYTFYHFGFCKDYIYYKAFCDLYVEMVQRRQNLMFYNRSN